jgi:cytochrome P450
MTGTHPGALDEVRSELRSSEPLKAGGAADRIVRETLRLHQSEFLIRRTTAPVDWKGLRIPQGWHVRMCVAESHRVPESFERPDEFDPRRFLTQVSRSRYAPFGFAPHTCLGEHLARSIGRQLVAELARGYTVSALNVEPSEFNGFHWAPSSRMKLNLNPV